MNERKDDSPKPKGPGAGLRSAHYPEILRRRSDSIQWFEIITENFLGTYGRPRWVLEKVRQDYPLAFHGVSLSIGSPEPIDETYLFLVRDLITEFDPFLVSDHFCWTGFRANNTHNLLPLPLNESSINIIVPKIERAQEILGREILFENASAYMKTQVDDIPEWDFISEVCQRTGCKLLLDLNNLYVTSVNFGIDPHEQLHKIPAQFVRQIHLAGFTDMGNYLFDTHSKAVHDHVWNLYTQWLRLYGSCPTMIEWDEEIPPFEVLEGEAAKIAHLQNTTVQPPANSRGASIEL
ncbi:MAG: hypothetical protein RJB66_890 [Pseudomonadota bacterium]|jgi:uncharacterized protein (UPF0276 family)